MLGSILTPGSSGPRPADCPVVSASGGLRIIRPLSCSRSPSAPPCSNPIPEELCHWLERQPPLCPASGPRVLSVPGSWTLRARASESRPAGEGAFYPHEPEDHEARGACLPDFRIKRRKGRECRCRASCLSSRSKWVASAELPDSRVKSRFLGFLEKLAGGPHVGLMLLEGPSAGPEGAIAPVHGASSPSGPVQGHLSLHGVTAALAENALFASWLTVSSSSRTEAAGQRDPPCPWRGVLSWCTGGLSEGLLGRWLPE